ncbi:dicarboxylate/amino acid:cation symporter [Brevibacterium paucivorans]|uniref:cation:dicarboxylate symporter family transporter n=1 Tax=Brevibacterium paucivorans TaxID=170994 RepID=UPI0031D35F8F
MKFGLLIRILIAVIAGLVVGTLLPDSLLSITESARVLLSGVLKFFIPLIILAFVGAGIADFKGKIGKLLGVSVALAYVDTVIAIGIAIAISVLLIPKLVEFGESATEGNPIPEPFMNMEVEPPLEILTALMLAFLLGIGATWDKSKTFRKLLFEFRDIVMWGVMTILLPLIPFFIFFSFIKLSAEGVVFKNLPLFLGMFLLVVLMQWGWLIVEYVTAAVFVGRKSPLMLRAMLPAYVTGMATMSSAVTMPVALREVKNSGLVSPRIAEFGIPLFNTVHQAAAGIGIAIGAMTVSIVSTGSLPDLGTLIAFTLLLAVIEVGAVGIPGGSILASMGVLTGTLGFGESELALMLTLFAIQDSFAAAGNVTGDGALTLLINRFFGNRAKAEEEQV